jgi:ABC-type antimicrobial peptide transport system permease subunit
MTNTKSSTQSGGIGFTGALTILFIGLKLGHVIAWSWWWVLSPLWIGFAVAVAVLLVVLVVAAVSR